MASTVPNDITADFLSKSKDHTKGDWYPEGTPVELLGGKEVISDGQGGYTLPPAGGVPPTDAQSADTKKFNNQAAVAGDYTAYGMRWKYQRDDQGNIDWSKPAIPVQTGDGDSSKDALTAQITKLQNEGTLTGDQAKQIEALLPGAAAAQAATTGATVASTGHTIAQTNLTTAQLKQYVQGGLETDIQQIASSDLPFDQKSKLIDARVDKAINDYTDATAKANALTVFQRTQTDQATKMAATAKDFIGNSVQSMTDLASKGGSGAGGALVSLLKAGPSMLGAYGGSPVQLKDPLSLYANTQGAGSQSMIDDAKKAFQNNFGVHPDEPVPPEVKQKIIDNPTQAHQIVSDYLASRSSGAPGNGGVAGGTDGSDYPDSRGQGIVPASVDYPDSRGQGTVSSNNPITDTPFNRAVGSMFSGLGQQAYNFLTAGSPGSTQAPWFGYGMPGTGSDPNRMPGL